MSIKETSRIWEKSTHIEGTSLLLLLALADYANEWGYCWPGRKKLASMARCDVATVSRLLIKMEADGEIATIKQAGSGNHYVILSGCSETEKTDRRKKLDQVRNSSDQKSLPAKKGSDKKSLGVVTNDHQGSDIGTGKTVPDPSVNPSIDPIPANAGGKSDRDALFEAVLFHAFEVMYVPGLKLDAGTRSRVGRIVTACQNSGITAAQYVAYAEDRKKRTDLSPVQSEKKVPLEVIRFLQRKPDAGAIQETFHSRLKEV